MSEKKHGDRVRIAQNVDAEELVGATGTVFSWEAYVREWIEREIPPLPLPRREDWEGSVPVLLDKEDCFALIRVVDLIAHPDEEGAARPAIARQCEAEAPRDLRPDDREHE